MAKATSSSPPTEGGGWGAPRSHRLGTQPSQESTLPNSAGHREAVVDPESGDIPNRLRAIDLREMWQRDGLLG